MNRNVLLGISSVAVLALAGCVTDPGRTTGIGAATGGVLGASLGAVVGSQTGDPGSGFLLGAAAGSAAGAAIGNSLEAEEERLEEREEAIQRQQQLLAIQRSQIEELRAGADTAEPRGFSQSPRGGSGTVPRVDRAPRGSLSGAGFAEQDLPTSFETTPTRTDTRSSTIGAPAGTQLPIRPSGDDAFDPERVARAAHETAPKAAAPKPSSIFAPINSQPLVKPPEESGSEAEPEEEVEKKRPTKTTVSSAKPASRAPEPEVDPEVEVPVQKAESKTTVASLSPSSSQPAGSECEQADGEVQKAEAVSESADKLFHLRRALRLCPGKPEYHVHLADLYRSLKRRTDAEFEYKEALKVDPNHGDAKTKLEEMKSE